FNHSTIIISFYRSLKTYETFIVGSIMRDCEIARLRDCEIAILCNNLFQYINRTESKHQSFSSSSFSVFGAKSIYKRRSGFTLIFDKPTTKTYRLPFDALLLIR
ncbi:MAG TPA: hypothetical protein PK633_06685, partial [Agitococcus sp.]|nr:hypothetical protein [Agitococcus sp.]